MGCVRLTGNILVPSDKSISHRALMFAPFATGESKIRFNILGRDNLATLRIMRQLGVKIEGELSEGLFKLAEEEGVAEGFSCVPGDQSQISIFGKGFAGLEEPSAVLDCGNSGTTARLLCGLLAGRAFKCEITGDESLCRRPFKRVVEPLSLMGANFSADMLPFKLEGGGLHGIEFSSPRASAQVKSAVLLAGLQASGDTVVREPMQSRDHSERMLQAMGGVLDVSRTESGGWEIKMSEKRQPDILRPIDIEIPGDFSAAAFFLVAGSIIEGSKIRIRNVGCNPTRTGLLDILLRMGAAIELKNCRTQAGEEVADFEVCSSSLKGVEVTSEEVVRAIDEIPILAVAASFATGTTTISGASELRVKESDRLAMIASLLQSEAVAVEELEDGLIINGQGGAGEPAVSRGPDRDPDWQNSGDHRIAMSGAVLQFAKSGHWHLEQKNVVETSFPGFSEQFASNLV